MKRLAWLACLVVVPTAVYGDVVELKSGQRVEGVLKAASPAKISVEIGAQTVVFETVKVRAIYFGADPQTQTPSSSHDEALRAIKSLQSIVNTGTTFRDYAPRVGEAAAASDRYLSTATPAEQPAASTLHEAAMLHTVAMRAWSERLANGRLDFRSEPVIVP